MRYARFRRRSRFGCIRGGLLLVRFGFIPPLEMEYRGSIQWTKKKNGLVFGQSLTPGTLPQKHGLMQCGDSYLLNCGLKKSSA